MHRDYHREKVTQRGRIIGMRDAGLTHSEIAREFGISRTTVYLWLRRWEEEGNLKDQIRSGSPKIATFTGSQRIINYSLSHRFRNIVRIKDDRNIDASPMTI